MNSIVIDARMINSSGIGRYLQNILPAIINHFQNVTLLGDKALLQEKLNQLNLSVIPFSKPVYSVSEQLEYLKVIPKCEIFFSPHYNVPLLPVRAKYRIVTIHDVFHLAFYKNLNASQKIYSKLVINHALKKSDAIITISKFSKDEICQYTDNKYSNKISIIHIYTDSFTCENININPVDTLNSYFLFVGNVKPHKNLKRAIEAFRLLLLDTTMPTQGLRFIIVGKKEGFITGDNDIVSFINDMHLQEKVTFTGWISDEELLRLYANALAFVFPSYYEGFGLPPLEAMSLGTPVIASTAASMPEICGEAALYFDPFDVMDIYAKMKCIISDDFLRNDLIKKGINNVKRFTKDLSINSHIQLFEKFLNI